MEEELIDYSEEAVAGSVEVEGLGAAEADPVAEGDIAVEGEAD